MSIDVSIILFFFTFQCRTSPKWFLILFLCTVRNIVWHELTSFIHYCVLYVIWWLSFSSLYFGWDSWYVFCIACLRINSVIIDKRVSCTVWLMQVVCILLESMCFILHVFTNVNSIVSALCEALDLNNSL